MTNRLRVLLDARKARDFGIGRVVLGLLGGLAALDGAPELVALVRRGDEALLPAGVRPERCDAAGYSAAELVSVRRAIARVRPDVFHAPHYVLPLRPPRATVVTIHDLMHLSRPEHDTLAKRLYARVMVRRAVRLAARVLVPSEASRAELLAFDPRAAAKTVAIPNGLDPRFRASASPDDRRRVRRAYGIDAAFVLFAGNDKPHKNLAGLLAAFARLDAKGPLLVVAGGAPERRDERRRAAEALGIAARVVDVGIVPDEDLAALIADARALALPSLAEGFGLPVIEAQALGTPVVCSDRGALPEVAGGAALVVNPEDAGALAEALRRAVNDEALRASLVERGSANAKRFTWEDSARRTLDVYRQAAEARA